MASCCSYNKTQTCHHGLGALFAILTSIHTLLANSTLAILISYHFTILSSLLHSDSCICCSFCLCFVWPVHSHSPGLGVKQPFLFPCQHGLPHLHASSSSAYVLNNVVDFCWLFSICSMRAGTIFILFMLYPLCYLHFDSASNIVVDW